MAKWKWFVYILESLDGSYQTEMSQNPSEKLGHHRVERLVYLEECEDLHEAKNRELQIKDWNKSKMKSLISNHWCSQW